jgi:hypothetical protein
MNNTAISFMQSAMGIKKDHNRSFDSLMVKVLFLRIGCHDKLLVGYEALIMQLIVDLVLIIGISALRKDYDIND